MVGEEAVATLDIIPLLLPYVRPWAASKTPCTCRCSRWRRPSTPTCSAAGSMRLASTRPSLDRLRPGPEHRSHVRGQRRPRPARPVRWRAHQGHARLINPRGHPGRDAGLQPARGGRRGDQRVPKLGRDVPQARQAPRSPGGTEAHPARRAAPHRLRHLPRPPDPRGAPGVELRRAALGPALRRHGRRVRERYERQDEAAAYFDPAATKAPADRRFEALRVAVTMRPDDVEHADVETFVPAELANIT